MLIAVLVSAILLITTYLISKRLTLSVLSEELAKTTGISAKTINFIYLFLVGTVVALGVKFVGTLLTGALVIIPAASAKNFSRSLRGYALWSIIFGVFSSIIGVLLAAALSLSPGPIVVLVSISIFLLTFLFKFFSAKN
jgi:ABC-type Mn2+/Zn2+ transport system permease subunit